MSEWVRVSVELSLSRKGEVYFDRMNGCFMKSHLDSTCGES